MSQPSVTYKRHRFPPQIIAHAVWLYYRFPLSCAWSRKCCWNAGHGFLCFKSARQFQRFVSIHDPIANLFHFPRNNISSAEHRDLRNQAMNVWREVACVSAI